MRQLSSAQWALFDVVLITLVSGVVALSIQDALGVNLSYPLSSEAGDSTFYAAHVFKASLDNPWYLHNQFLNAPNGFDIHDFPCPDMFALGFIKLVGLFSKNWAFVENVYYITSYPITALAAFATLRLVGIRRALAAASALAFAFLPFHQMRGFGHILFGCTYWQAPLTALLGVMLLEDRPLFLTARDGSVVPRLLLDRPSLAAFGLAVFIGLTGMVYYPFFSLGCVLVATVSGAVAARSRWPLLRGGVVLGGIGAGIAVNVIPSLLYSMRQGRSAVIVRSPADAEVFGLKLTSLVLPPQGHRIPALSLWRKGYDTIAPLTNENITAYLGMLGVVGLAYVGYRLFFPSHRLGSDLAAEGDARVVEQRIDLFSRSAAFCFLFGTIGGLGSLVAFTVFNKVRSINRISPFIAFFCLAALALAAERSLRRVKNEKLVRALTWGVAPAIAAFAIWEQSFEVRRDWNEIHARYDATREYYRGIEAKLPPNGMIFTVPFVSFPEAPPLNKLADYEMSQPYLFTSSVRYSYPSMLGRPDAAWHERLANVDPEDLPDALALNGYDGLLLYRVGYADGGQRTESILSARLGPPTVAVDGRSVFFNLVAHKQALVASLGPKAAAMAEFFKDGPTIRWAESFGNVETLNDHRWYWMLGQSGSIVLKNPMNHSVRVALSFELTCDSDTFQHLHLRSTQGDEMFIVERKPQRVAHTLDLPPGELTLHLETDAPRVNAPKDSRTLYVQFFDPTLRLAE